MKVVVNSKSISPLQIEALLVHQESPVLRSQGWGWGQDLEAFTINQSLLLR